MVAVGGINILIAVAYRLDGAFHGSGGDTRPFGSGSIDGDVPELPIQTVAQWPPNNAAKTGVFELHT